MMETADAQEFGQMSVELQKHREQTLTLAHISYIVPYLHKQGAEGSPYSEQWNADNRECKYLELLYSFWYE